MTRVFALSWRLLRSGGGNRLSALLVLLAVTASTALLLFAIAANHAFAQRAVHEAWRHPQPATGAATAVEALRTDYVRGEPIRLVDLAALNRSQAPVPPGMPRFPRAGEVWVSPALADLISDLPADQLADRFGDHVTGELGRDAVTRPGELVAVVGHAPGDPAMQRQRVDGEGIVSPTRIDSYATSTDMGNAALYQVLAKVATALMVVPLLVFGGAAARLTVARRDSRLAALRLVGATPAQVVGLTVVEAVFTAVGGAALGIGLYALAMPALARIPMMGGGWFVTDLWPGTAWVLGMLVGVPLLVGASAVVGLRRVVVSPLGVARRQTPPGMKAIRAVIALALVIAFPIAANGAGRLGVGIVVALLALAFLGLNLLGPWVVGLLGRIVAATADRPARLLAGRRLVDDPRAAWRTVSGLALIGFVAGFLALLNPTAFGASSQSGPTHLSVAVPRDRVATVADRTQARLDRHQLDTRVHVRPGRSPDRRRVDVALVGGAGEDTVRTALAGTVPGHVFTSHADASQSAVVLGRDIRTGVFVVLAVCYLVAIVSAGIMAVSAVLDRRRAYGLLRLAGTPLAVLDRARLQETLIPLAVMGGGSLLAGLVCAAPFALASLVEPYGLAMLAVFVGIGTLGVIGANVASRPLLRAVTADPSPQAD